MPHPTASHAKNTPNVRTIIESIQRLGLAALNRFAPSLAAQAVERLFLSPKRFARPEWETEALRSAQRLSLLRSPTGSRASTHSKTCVVVANAWGPNGADTVLLVHGWEGRGSQMAAFVPPLLARGLHVVALDMPGHGDSDAQLSSVVDFARTLQDVIPQLGSVIGVIGHSMGGAASVLAHTGSTAQRRLVSIGAPRGPRVFFDAFCAYLELNARTSAALEQRLARRFGMAIDEVDVAHGGASMKLPTLVIHDRTDKEVPFAHAEAMMAALPHAQLGAYEGFGHRRILRESRVIAEAVAFIAGTQPSNAHA